MASCAVPRLLRCSTVVHETIFFHLRLTAKNVKYVSYECCSALFKPHVWDYQSGIQIDSKTTNFDFVFFQDGGFEVPLDNDQQDLAFYSVENGDVLLISW